METEAGSGVIVTLVSAECYLSGYWLKTWTSVNMFLGFFLSLSLAFLYLSSSIFHFLLPSVWFAESLSPPQALESSFPPLDWKSDLQCILKEFLALLAKLCQRYKKTNKKKQNTDSGHGKDKTKGTTSIPPLQHKECFQREATSFSVLTIILSVRIRAGVCYNCSRFGECLPVLIYKMPHGWSSLFDLSELLMPSLDERLDLPALGRSLMLWNGKG